MGPGSQTPETALTLAAKLKEAEREIHNLEVENRRLQRTNEILDKAARFFAASQEK
jgi:transposase